MKIVIENVSLHDLDRVSALMYALGFSDGEIRNGCRKLLMEGILLFPGSDDLTVVCKT